MSSNAVKSEDSPCGRLTFQPDLEDVFRSVHVSIMRRAAARTDPRPHSKRAPTLRTTVGDHPAARARLGSPSFIGLNINRLPSGSLVPQHMSERRPSSVQDGFRHLGFSQCGCVHVSNNDKIICPRNKRGLFVKMVATNVGNLCAYGSCRTLISRLLSPTQGCLVLPIVLHRRDGFPGTDRGKCLQSEIDTNRTVPRRKIICNVAVYGYIPAPTSVLDKSAAFELTGDFARLPEPKSLFQINGGISVNSDRTRNKWDPSQGALWAGTGPKPRAPSMLVPRPGELAANRLYSIGVQPKDRRSAGGQLYKIERRRPSDWPSRPTPAFGLTLSGNAKIPNLIAGTRMPSKQLFAGPIFNPVFEGQHGHQNKMQWFQLDFKSARHE